jgi:hypothetical protein
VLAVAVQPGDGRILIAASLLSLLPWGAHAQAPKANGETLNIQNYAGTTGNMHAVVARAKGVVSHVALGFTGLSEHPFLSASVSQLIGGRNHRVIRVRARVAPMVEAMIVVGAPNSSNSQRLKEVAERAGCARALLVQRAADIDWTMFDNIGSLGVTAGASAPEVLVEEVLGAFAERYRLDIETVSATEEKMFFPLPRALRHNEAAE